MRHRELPILQGDNDVVGAHVWFPNPWHQFRRSCRLSESSGRVGGLSIGHKDLRFEEARLSANLWFHEPGAQSLLPRRPRCEPCPKYPPAREAPAAAELCFQA